MSTKEGKKVKLSTFILALILIALVCGLLVILIYTGVIGNKKAEPEVAKLDKVEEEIVLAENEYKLLNNNFSKFDLSFLKLENEKKNKIYSPLSIKYALKMLEEGTSGEAKAQLDSIASDYAITPYTTNSKMAFANALFIRDTFKDEIKDEYKNTLKTKYNAEIQTDSFSNAKTINNWVNKNTLGLIPDIFEDNDVSNFDFALINALGIDMEWQHKFLKYWYEDDDNITSDVSYQHENIGWGVFEQLQTLKFDKTQDVSSMKVIATLNNYDIVKELGEDKIKETVKNAFIEWVNSDQFQYEKDNDTIQKLFENDYSNSGIDKAFEKYWAEGFFPEYGKSSYLDEIKTNVGRVDYTTDFSLYVDDDVKVFAKDLEKVNGTTLQYVGIMPINEDLDKFIENTSEEDILSLINNLKKLKLENFNDGVLTKITGFIPKFTFDYELDLQKDLNKIGITNIFESGKANLTKLTDNKDAFISKIKHKANIEFTEDGIKAAATTGAGGAGAGDLFDYIFEIPVEEIDITFDKPYMFLIRDKETGETWFVGTVYNPLDAKDETGPLSGKDPYGL